MDEPGSIRHGTHISRALLLVVADLLSAAAANAADGMLGTDIVGLVDGSLNVQYERSLEGNAAWLAGVSSGNGRTTLSGYYKSYLILATFDAAEARPYWKVRRHRR